MGPDETETARELLARVCGTEGSATSLPSTLFVFAHPNDEALGASHLVARARGASFAYVTDGAPRDGLDAKAAGFATSGAYARGRQRELAAAMRLAAVDLRNVHHLNVPDHESVLNLAWIIHELADLYRRLRPQVVVTHPYEGGHPDHDATALAAHAAAVLQGTQHGGRPLIVEATSYHVSDGAFRFGTFLEPDRTPSVEIPLTTKQREFKERLLGCYPTQQRVLRSATMHLERYRIAPDYDFLSPPHRGQLLYELSFWNMPCTRWLRLARTALDELGLADALGEARGGQDATARCFG